MSLNKYCYILQLLLPLIQNYLVTPTVIRLLVVDVNKHYHIYWLIAMHGLIIIHTTTLDYCHSQTRAMACT